MKRVLGELQRFARTAFWLVPMVVLQMHGFGDRTVILVATSTGILWQVVYRRDLADRLAVLAMFWMVVPVGVALIFGSASRLEIGPLGATVGIVMGLVAAEQFLRFLDGRRILRERARRDAAVPA